MGEQTTHDDGRVHVTKAVAEGLEAVRRSGVTNMLDRPRVVEMVAFLGYDETAEWVAANRSAYARLIFHGMTIDDEGRKAAMTDRLRALIYCRVSTDEQARGYSLVTQLESCRRYCADHSYTVLADFNDAHSGTELDRPGLNALIDAVKQVRPEVVVLHDVDRLGREIIVQAIAERDLSRHGARIEYVLGGGNGTPSDELLKTVKGAIAVFENRQRVERSKRGKDARVRDGHPLVADRPAYGYRYVGGERAGRLEPHPEEVPVVVLIFRWCVEDGLTTYEIAKRLHAEGVPTRADADPAVCKKAGRGVWSPSVVGGILRNETYKGEWFWNKTKRVDPTEAQIAKRRKDGTGNPERKVQVPRPRAEWLSLPVEPLIDAATWERAQARLAGNKQMARRNAKRDYLLSGRVFCSCGRRWTGRYYPHIDRGSYRCPSTKSEPWRAPCPARFSLGQTRLEAAVLGAVRAFLLDADTRRAALGAEREQAAAERHRLADDLATIDRSLARLDRQLAKLLDDVLTDDFPPELVAKRKRDLVAERHQLAADREQRLAALDEPVIDVEAAVADLAPTVEAAFAAAEPADLRRLLDLLRVEAHVIDREHVRLTGIIGAVVTLSPA